MNKILEQKADIYQIEAIPARKRQLQNLYNKWKLLSAAEFTGVVEKLNKRSPHRLRRVQFEEPQLSPSAPAPSPSVQSPPALPPSVQSPPALILPNETMSTFRRANFPPFDLEGKCKLSVMMFVIVASHVIRNISPRHEFADVETIVVNSEYPERNGPFEVLETKDSVNMVGYDIFEISTSGELRWYEEGVYLMHQTGDDEVVVKMPMGDYASLGYVQNKYVAHITDPETLTDAQKERIAHINQVRADPNRKFKYYILHFPGMTLSRHPHSAQVEGHSMVRPNVESVKTVQQLEGQTLEEARNLPYVTSRVYWRLSIVKDKTKNYQQGSARNTSYLTVHES